MLFRPVSATGLARKWFALALLAVIGAPLAAREVTWTVSGTFSDGGNLSGTFAYDPVSGSMRTWNLITSGGNTATFPPYTYTPQNSSFQYVSSRSTLLFQGPPNPAISSEASRTRDLRIGPFNAPLSDDGSSRSLTPDNFGNLECYNCAPSRLLTGTISGVPGPDPCAQPGACPGLSIITTIAGTDPIPPVGPVSAQSLYLPYTWAIVADGNGSVYVSDIKANVVYRIDTNGTATAIAGTGICTFGGDGGPARLASICDPRGLALDASGNLYIADFGNGAVRRVSADGTMTTIAGGSSATASGVDIVPSTSLALRGPVGVATAPGGIVYVSDIYLDRVFVVQNGLARPFAGNGIRAYSGDGGPALQASLDPYGLATDTAGNLFIADYTANAIRRVNTNGTITSVVGSPSATSFQDGLPANQTVAFAPYSVAVDSKGQVFFTDAYSYRVRYVGMDGIVRTVAGDGTPGYRGDGGPASKAQVSFPIGVTLDKAGSIYITDTFNLAVRKINTSGVISTLARTPVPAPDPVPALTVPFGTPYAIAVAADGTVYFGDGVFPLVRKVSRDGMLRTVVGNGVRLPYDGVSAPALSVTLGPTGVAVDAEGNLYVGSSFNGLVGARTGALGAVLRVSKNGTATLFAGSQSATASGDGGPAVNALLSSPRGLAVDDKRNVYICDFLLNRVRRVDASGIITTFAGNGRTGSGGDGGKATDAPVNSPIDVVARNGNVYILEGIDKKRILVVTPDGLIHTIAGNGSFGIPNEGQSARTSPLGDIGGIAVDPSGLVYFSEKYTDRIRRIEPDGTVRTVAGIEGFPTRDGNFSGDGGPAAKAGIAFPQGIAFDAEGNLYIADGNNLRIRKILAASPTFAVDRNALSFTAKSGGAPDTPQTLAVTASVPGVSFTVSTSAPWLQASISSGSTPRQVSITADPENLAPGQYQGTVQFLAPNAGGASANVAVAFRVDSGQPAQVQTDLDGVTFTLPRSGGLQSQLLVLSNSGSGSFAFTATPTTRTGGNWLSVSPNTGNVTARQPVTLTVTANIQGLAPGTYAGRIVVDAGAAGSKNVQVTLTVSSVDQALLLTQVGLSFTAVSGGGLAPPQSFGVKNLGTGSLNWTTSPLTTDGHQWLSITPASGTSVGGAPSPLASVSVDQRGLSPKRYYGLARVNAPAAPNSPQVVTIHLDVLPPGSDPGAVIQPAELVFAVSAGEGVGAQEILIYNLTAAPINFRAGSSPATFLFRPYDGVVQPGVPFRMLIQPVLANSQPGVVNGTLSLQFGNGQVRSVPLRVEVSSVSGPAASPASGRDAAGVCLPTKLIPAFSLIGQSSSNVPAAWPNGLSVDVQDDCKRPVTAGTVSVQFSNGDPPLSLSSNGDGKWQGTWLARDAVGAVTLTVRATEAQTNLSGATQALANVQTNYDPPVTTKQSIVSTANPVAYQPITPGGFISIYGQRLSSSTSPLVAGAGPLPTSLGDTSVVLGGREVPLSYVSETQINGVVPWNLTTDTQQQLLILRGPAYSDPVGVSVAQAQPALFRYPQPGAPQQGIFIVVRPGGTPPSFLNATATPARAGDTLVIYSLGLGPVTHQPDSGSPSPANPLAQTNATPILRIGDRTVDVSFAGLSPGFVGLYQVQTTLPSGLATGDAVPVTLEIGGQLSAPVTIALE